MQTSVLRKRKYPSPQAVEKRRKLSTVEYLAASGPQVLDLLHRFAPILYAYANLIPSPNQHFRRRAPQRLASSPLHPLIRHDKKVFVHSHRHEGCLYLHFPTTKTLQLHLADLVIFCNKYIVLNVPREIVFSCPINKSVDWRVGRKFRISRIKTTYIVNHYNYFTHSRNIPPNHSKLIDNGCVLRSFKSNAGRIMAV